MQITNFVGLNRKAKELVTPSEVIIGYKEVYTRFNSGRLQLESREPIKTPNITLEPYCSLHLSDGEKTYLLQYNLGPGRYYREVAQQIVRGNLYIRLEDEKGNIVEGTDWTPKEMGL